MNDLRGSMPVHSGHEKPAGAEHDLDDPTVIPRRRYARWGRIAAVALVAASMTWAIGRDVSKRIESYDIEIASRPQPPLPGFPKPSETVKKNNEIMRLGLVGDLDGMPVPYTAEADGLVSKADGRFLTDLSLEQMARILHVDPASISKPDSHEIDPGAVLFKVQSGTLTPQAKIRSREGRKTQPWYVWSEWVICDFSFTLQKLRAPNEQERAVLTAISRAARQIPPEPGDKFRAIGVNRGEFDHGTIITPGMLPLESRLPPPVPHDEP